MLVIHMTSLFKVYGPDRTLKQFSHSFFSPTQTTFPQQKCGLALAELRSTIHGIYLSRYSSSQCLNIRHLLPLGWLKAFGRSRRRMTAARKIEVFLCEVGEAWHMARVSQNWTELYMKYHRQVCEESAEIRRGPD
jgi:hypothetical protein